MLRLLLCCFLLAGGTFTGSTLRAQQATAPLPVTADEIEYLAGHVDRLFGFMRTPHQEDAVKNGIQYLHVSMMTDKKTAAPAGIALLKELHERISGGKFAKAVTLTNLKLESVDTQKYIKVYSFEVAPQAEGQQPGRCKVEMEPTGRVTFMEIKGI